jgi:hypothetical protein
MNAMGTVFPRLTHIKLGVDWAMWARLTPNYGNNRSSSCAPPAGDGHQDCPVFRLSFESIGCFRARNPPPFVEKFRQWFHPLLASHAHSERGLVPPSRAWRTAPAFGNQRADRCGPKRQGGYVQGRSSPSHRPDPAKRRNDSPALAPLSFSDSHRSHFHDRPDPGGCIREALRLEPRA